MTHHTSTFSFNMSQRRLCSLSIAAACQESCHTSRLLSSGAKSWQMMCWYFTSSRAVWAQSECNMFQASAQELRTETCRLAQVRIHIKVISCVQHSSHSLDYGSVDQLLPLLDDGLLVGQVAKKGSTRRQISVLSSWVEAWNILHSDCAQTAFELVKYQHIICQLFAPDGSSLELLQLFWQAAAMHKLHNLRWDMLKEDVLVWCVTHQPFHAWQQPVPSRLTTTPAGTTPPSGAHGVSHPQYRPGDLPALQLWQVQQEGRVLFYPQVLGPRLWWRALCQGLAMCCTSGPVISSEFTPLYDQLSHTTL